MCVFAPEASVALMPSATSDKTSAASYTSCGSELSGGFNSAVMANKPARKTRSRRDPARQARSFFILSFGVHPALRTNLIALGQEIDPRGGALQTPVDRWLKVMNVLAPQRDEGRAFNRLSPDARLVGKKLRSCHSRARRPTDRSADFSDNASGTSCLSNARYIDRTCDNRKEFPC